MTAAAFGLAAALLLVLAPLELRQGLALGPLTMTTAEMVGAVAAAVGLGSLWRGWRTRALPLPTLAEARWPLLGLAAWAAVHLASALWADPPALGVVKPALRIAAEVLLAMLCYLHAGDAAFRRRFAAGLIGSLVVIAALGIGERVLGREFEFALLQFRDEPTWMLGEQRLATVFYHANTCAAFFELTSPLALLMGLLASGWRRWALLLLAALSALLLSVTYSRAGFGAALAGAAVLAWALWRRRQARWGWQLALGWWLLVAGAYVANPDMRARIGLDERSYRPQYRFLDGCAGHPGDVVPVRVEVKNRGAWPLSNRQAVGSLIHVLINWRGKKVGGGWTWTELPDIAPGQTGMATLKVALPGPPGDYVLAVDIMRDEVLRISAAGAPMAFLGCGVYDPAAAVTPGDTAQVVPANADAVRVHRMIDLERRHYWRAALLLWARRPWLGWGSDRFHDIHREYVPSVGYDSRARAHSIFGETAVDLGLAGVAVLAALLALVGRACWRAVRQFGSGGALALGLAAGLAGFFVHSLVDYFLGYTQIALVVWPMVGTVLRESPQQNDANSTV